MNPYLIIPVPEAKAVTRPVAVTVAMLALTLLQMPPVAVSDNCVVNPVQRFVTPEIVPVSGMSSTTIILEADSVAQPLLTVKYTVSVPALTPVISPLLTAALALLTLHTPPVTVSVRLMVLPAQTDEGPLIIPGSGNGLTVNVANAVSLPQPLLTTYEIVVVPFERPVSIPVLLLIVAMKGFCELQAPPATVLERVITAPVHALLPRCAASRLKSCVVRCLLAVVCCVHVVLDLDSRSC